jgi:hypothetical protein
MANLGRMRRENAKVRAKSGASDLAGEYVKIVMRSLLPRTVCEQ